MTYMYISNEWVDLEAPEAGRQWPGRQEAEHREPVELKCTGLPPAGVGLEP